MIDFVSPWFRGDRLQDFLIYRMKSNDIKRSVGTQRHDRVPGEAPSMGRVARIRGTGLPKGVRRKRKIAGRGNRDRDRRRRVIRTWTYLLGGLVSVFLVISVWLWLRPQMDRRDEMDGQKRERSVESERVASRFPSPSEGEALALVTEGLAVRETGKIEEYFRIGSASLKEVVDFLEGLEVREGLIERYEWMSSVDANGLLIDGVSIHFKGEDKPRSRLALLTPDATGSWKIDFGALARTSVPTWDDLVAKGSETAEVRVEVVRDSYFNGYFKDDEQWICYAMNSPEDDRILWGYCRSQSSQAAAMTWIFSKRANKARVTLKIRRADASEPRQYEISKVLAEDWVLGKTPFDEGF